MRLSRALILAVLTAVGVIVPGGYVAASGNLAGSLSFDHLAVDLNTFDLAEGLLVDVSRQAEAMAASGAFGAKKPEDFLEDPPMYFRQKRVRYFCPEIPARPSLACPYSR